MKFIKQKFVSDYSVFIFLDPYYEMYMLQISFFALNHLTKCFESKKEAIEFYEKITENSIKNLLTTGEF